MLMSDISALAKLGQIYAYRQLRDHQLNGSEHAILSFLLIHHQVNQDHIADYMMLDKGTIARILAKLEEKQFITRVVNPRNKREKHISITQSGQQAVAQLQSITEHWSHTLLADIPLADQQLTAQVLNKMKQNAKTLIHQEEC